MKLQGTCGHGSGPPNRQVWWNTQGMGADQSHLFSAFLEERQSAQCSELERRDCGVFHK